MGKAVQWASGLVSEVLGEVTSEAEQAQRAAAEQDQREQRLAAGIQGWWQAFVAELRRAVDALSPVLGGVVVNEDAGQFGILAPWGTFEAKVTAEGALRVYELVDEGGGPRYLRLEPVGDRIDPAPAEAARQALEPWARSYALFAQVKRRMNP